MQEKPVFLALLCVLACFTERTVAGRSQARNSIHNDVIKEKPIPNVPSDTYEAFYYSLYNDPLDAFSGYPNRPGEATVDSSCDYIRDVPKSLRSPEHMAPYGLSEFYQRYTEAYGIPVVASASVSDEALERACYVLRFLLADRQDIRNAFYLSQGRVSLMGRDEQLTDLPEYDFLDDKFDDATRGLGAVPMIPVSSAAEENVLCEEDDLYLSEDILIREIAMGILHIGAKKSLPGFYEELQEHYIHAKRSGWWKNTYALHTVDSYFGEGVQSFFDVNGFSRIPDGRHNHVSIRTRLRTYDSQLYSMVQKIFPCANRYISRCNSRGHENHQKLTMDCPIPFWSRHGKRRRRINRVRLV